MHTHQTDSFLLLCMFWATKYICYFLALYFAFHGAANLVRGTGHVFHYAFKSFRKYSFSFLLVSIYCFIMAAAFYNVTTSHFLAFIEPYYFKNILITLACEVVIIFLPINLKNTFVYEAEQHQTRINTPEETVNQ